MKVLNEKKTFVDTKEHDITACPFELFLNDLTSTLKHINAGCPFTSSKQQRIYGQVADLIDFDDTVYTRTGTP